MFAQFNKWKRYISGWDSECRQIALGIFLKFMYEHHRDRITVDKEKEDNLTLLPIISIVYRVIV